MARLFSDLVSGAVVQQVNVEDGAVATGTTVMPYDDTVPTNTEGFEVMTLSITPKSSSNILIIRAKWHYAQTGSSRLNIGAIYQDSTSAALASAAAGGPYAGQVWPVWGMIEHQMVAGTTSATTFKLRIGCSVSDTTTFNGASSVRKMGGSQNSFMTITEVLA